DDRHWRAVPCSLKEPAMSPADSDNPTRVTDPDTRTDTRQTAILIFRDEGVDWPQLAADGRSKMLFQKLVDWAADLKRRGLYAGVEALAQSGKTVRRKGASIVIDGPFAEGREAVLGFFLVRVRDLDEACAIAGESPHAEVGGATEVRLLGTFPKP
ncbi:MAG TPA: YciI family protein, partial [Polyangiaceae bacterium]|nr:YciI family protein [Polyangiaceae bacterium]